VEAKNDAFKVEESRIVNAGGWEGYKRKVI
jgi:hypothetical protein